MKTVYGICDDDCGGKFFQLIVFPNLKTLTEKWMTWVNFKDKRRIFVTKAALNVGLKQFSG